MEEKVLSRKTKIGEVILFIGFILYYLSQFYYQTMFEFPLKLVRIFKYSGLLLIVIKILFFDEFKIKRFIVPGILACFFAAVAYYSSYRVLLEYLIIVMGFRNVNYKKILILFMSTCSVSLLATIICCKVGLIENVITYRSSGTMRQSLGILYSTDLAAFFFYLFAAYLCLDSHMPNIRIIIVSIVTCIGVYFLYTITDARLDCISIVGVLIATMIVSIIDRRIFDFTIVKVLIKNIFIICSISIILLTIFYNSDIPQLKKIDSMISTRLAVGKKIYDKYGIQLFGQHIEEHGAGGTQADKGKYKYEFIDCSYLKIIMKYGIISFIIISFFSVALTHRLYNKEKYKMMTVFIFIMINSMIAHHYTEIVYNFMILLLMASFDRIPSETMEEIEDNYEEE